MTALTDTLPVRLLGCLSALYSCAIKSRNWMYDKRLFKETRVSIPVISVGNLTVGGTGKTPMVIKLAGAIHQAGLQPAVLTRGYGGMKGCSPEKVSVDANFREYGDEAVLMARVLTKIPVVVSRDRVKGARWIIEHEAADCLLLDDGFQHRRIARDCNIVMLDSRFPFTQAKLLPSGQLRETIDGLKRSDIIVFSHTDVALPTAKDLEWLRSWKDPQRIFLSKHIPTGVRIARGDRQVVMSDKNTCVALISSIGSPSGFKHTAEKFGLNIRYEKSFRDHKALTQNEWLSEIDRAEKKGCTHVVITAKDESRFPEKLETALPVCVLDMAIEIDREEELIFKVMAAIENKQ